jgi:hypothetical protein
VSLSRLFVTFCDGGYLRTDEVDARTGLEILTFFAEILCKFLFFPANVEAG